MQKTDHDLRLSGDVIPFQPRAVQSKKGQTKKVMTTTIAALIAVTILHDETESPEDKLIDMIEANGEAETFVRQITGDNGNHFVSYGTEAGQFQERGYSAVICGPGDISVAHQPDEYVSVDDMLDSAKVMAISLEGLLK